MNVDISNNNTTAWDLLRKQEGQLSLQPLISAPNGFRRHTVTYHSVRHSRNLSL